MKLFIVNCINVIICDGDATFDDEQLGVFSTRELAEQFITTLPRVIGDNYWNNDTDQTSDAFDMQLARYEIKELIVTDSGRMPWGMLSSEEEDRILAHLVYDNEPEHISHPLCSHCNHYHAEDDFHFLDIDDDLPF